ncbi:hypothetical protein RF11_15915 [Thelohanellus kitauei]|uniref:Tc1-like transposase DDE domain-containing protein n=1 Tax=Thelohanellus kitauei TaxID=669202 RepID=A0A0C2ML77_THEKT|nr:hypothetical protein RF11_15915 [Thelohanellus kitauei]
MGDEFLLEVSNMDLWTFDFDYFQCFFKADLSQSEGIISIGPLSIKLNGSVFDLGDAGHLAFFKAQDHPFNEEHFCVHFMEAFELFFSSGIHECIFILDDVRFHKINRVQTMLQKKGRMVIYLPIYSSFLNHIENLLPKRKSIVIQTSPRSKTDLFNQVPQ